MLRKILGLYRNIQNSLFGRQTCGVLKPGERCTVIQQENSANHGDIVHPCIRYIKEGFRGHKWWMVYTPYYKANAAVENPILCWGEEIDSMPPTKWNVEEIVKDQPYTGYNSDPNLLYYQEKLIIYWRENDTNKILNEGLHHATMVKVFDENSSYEIQSPILSEEQKYSDKEVSPAFFQYKGQNFCYSMDLCFRNEKLILNNKRLNKLIQNITTLSDLIGLYSQQKSFGIAVWRGESLTEPFTYIGTHKIKKCNKLYRPWHLDVFESGGKLYALVQSNQCNADIILAESKDGITFTAFQKPLITNKTVGMLGIYKPTGGVVDGQFYLYYTAQSPSNRSLNQMFVTTSDFNSLLDSLR